MLLGARQFFERRGPKLPYDAEVEYLESTGTQWILAWSGTTDSTFGLKATFSCAYNSDNYPAGFSTLNQKRFLFWGPYSSSWRYGWGTYSTITATPRFPLSEYPSGLDNYYTGSINYLNNGKVSFGNDTLYGLPQVQYFQNVDFRLFRSFGAAVPACRILSATLTIGNKVVRDLIPVRKGMVGYMYDRVSGRLFGNAGTGAFLYGNNK